MYSWPWHIRKNAVLEGCHRVVRLLRPVLMGGEAIYEAHDVLHPDDTLLE
jgi:hypothetical protein